MLLLTLPTDQMPKVHSRLRKLTCITDVPVTTIPIRSIPENNRKQHHRVKRQNTEYKPSSLSQCRILALTYGKCTPTTHTQHRYISAAEGKSMYMEVDTQEYIESSRNDDTYR